MMKAQHASREIVVELEPPRAQVGFGDRAAQIACRVPNLPRPLDALAAFVFSLSLVPALAPVMMQSLPPLVLV
jgi:hypothetical protein